MPARSHPAKPGGVGIWPYPSSDPRDPLRWQQWLKVLPITVAFSSNLTSNFAASRMTVAIPVFTAQVRDKDASQINSTIAYIFLMLGDGNMIWVTLAVKLAKRFTLFVAMAMAFAVLLWPATSEDYTALLAARCLSGFASAAGESVVPGIVSATFFVHEHATMTSIYIIFITSGSAIGPLIAGYIVALTKETRRLGQHWSSRTTAFLIFAFLPQSSYVRAHPPSEDATGAGASMSIQGRVEGQRAREKQEPDSSEHQERHSVDDVGTGEVDSVAIPWTEIWSTTVRYNPSVSWIAAFVRPWIVVASPPILRVTYLYGTALAAKMVLTIAFTSLLLAAPYVWKAEHVGLGLVTACFGGGMISDRIFIHRVMRESERMYPEQCLIFLLPGCFIGPAGSILVAFACAQKLHWVSVDFGYGMVSFGTVYGPNVAIAYLIDGFPRLNWDCLVVINVLKDLIAFVLIYVAVDRIEESGWIQVYMIMFTLTTVAPLLAIPFYLWGCQIRALCSRIHHPMKREMC